MEMYWVPGSVAPYFKNLVKNGSATLPITHKNMTRFWITLDQAVDLVKTSLKNDSVVKYWYQSYHQLK